MEAEDKVDPAEKKPIQLKEVIITPKSSFARAAGTILLATGARTGTAWAITGADPEPFTKTVLGIATAAYSIYVIGNEIYKYNSQKTVNSKEYKKGDKLPTPETEPGKFNKKRGNQGWENKETGEIYQKSHTSHGNKNNEGTQWKVWPKGTNDFGPNSKKSGERTTLDQKGVVIGN